MPSNDPLKALLRNARLIWKVKARQLQSDLAEDQAEVQTINEQLTHFFGHLSNPKLWSEPVTYQTSDIAQHILDISAVRSDDVEGYLTATRQFLQIMQDQVLPTALQRVATTPTLPWNLRTIDALNQTTRSIEDRLDTYASQGTDLRQDPAFLALANRQAGLLANYRELLTNNAIESTQSKVNTINRWKATIAPLSDPPLFQRVYAKYNDFLAKQVQQTAATPILLGVAVSNNQQALDALAVAEVKLNREVADYQSRGVDLAEDTVYQALNAACPALLTNFRKALFNNDFEAPTTLIEALQRQGEELVQAPTQSAFLDQYRAFNDLLKTNTPAVA
ncbi:MAG: hypothetical protein AAFW73_16400 [Bacteroidota bacterium]